MTTRPVVTVLCQSCHASRAKVYRGPDGALFALYRGGRQRTPVDAVQRTAGQPDWRVTVAPSTRSLQWSVQAGGDIHQMRDDLPLQQCCAPATQVPYEQVATWIAGRKRRVLIPHSGLLW